jgi:hypothetical protein
MKYVYAVVIDKMEETYFSHTNTDFFSDPADRDKFNAELVIYADNEEDSLKIRTGITDIRMWELLRTES